MSICFFVDMPILFRFVDAESLVLVTMLVEGRKIVSFCYESCFVLGVLPYYYMRVVFLCSFIE